ncbi:MAG: HNH endonuclease [Nocardioides sp.]
MAATNSRRARVARRRTRRVASRVNDLAPEEWRALTLAWGRCAYCGATDKPLQRDCVLPIARGGRYTLANVVPACGSCNASKGRNEVTTWLRQRRLDEGAFLTRHAEIQTTLAAAFPVSPAATGPGR